MNKIKLANATLTLVVGKKKIGLKKMNTNKWLPNK